MTAPEKIALRWELGAAVTNGPLMTHPDYTQFVRADLCADPALLAEAVEVLRELITAEDDQDAANGERVIRAWDAATAFLSKLENRHDR